MITVYIMEILVSTFLILSILVGGFLLLLKLMFPGSKPILQQVVAELIHDALQGFWSLFFGPPRRRLVKRKTGRRK